MHEGSHNHMLARYMTEHIAEFRLHGLLASYEKLKMAQASLNYTIRWTGFGQRWTLKLTDHEQRDSLGMPAEGHDELRGTIIRTCILAEEMWSNKTLSPYSIIRENLGGG